MCIMINLKLPFTNSVSMERIATSKNQVQQYSFTSRWYYFPRHGPTFFKSSETQVGLFPFLVLCWSFIFLEFLLVLHNCSLIVEMVKLILSGSQKLGWTFLWKLSYLNLQLHFILDCDHRFLTDFNILFHTCFNKRPRYSVLTGNEVTS